MLWTGSIIGQLETQVHVVARRHIGPQPWSTVANEGGTSCAIGPETSNVETRWAAPRAPACSCACRNTLFCAESG